MELRVRHLGRVDYLPTWEQMRQLTDNRTPDTVDELWLLEHLPVFTQGQAGKAEHVLMPGDIPVVQTDRGGQVTYHGPGQLVAYPLLDLRRLGIGARDIVSAIENILIATLADYKVSAYSDPKAPGVYVGVRKIASLGLRIRKGCTYHGLALNVDLDLEPFRRINPCGHQGLDMTRLIDEAGIGQSFDPEQWDTLRHRLSGHFARVLGYTAAPFVDVTPES